MAHLESNFLDTQNLKPLYYKSYIERHIHDLAIR